MSKNNNRVFSDFLREEKELQYLFDYGLEWNETLVHMLCKKNSQNISELNRMLCDGVWEEIETVSFKDVADRKVTSSTRRMIKNNGYHLERKKWFRLVYHCYGYDNYSFLKEGHNYPCKKKTDKYQFDYCEGSRCEYRKNCQCDAEIDYIAELLSEVKRIEKYDFESKTLSEILKETIIFKENNGEFYQLRENEWTRKNVVSCGILSDDGYDRLLEMINFFSDFTPLSVLGENFLFRLGEKVKSYIYVRNLVLHEGLWQERIYRCLMAIRNGDLIVWNDQEYWPLKLVYGDCDSGKIQGHIYLEALKDGDVMKLPIWRGGELFLRKKRSLNLEDKRNKNRKETVISVKTYMVDFLSNDSEAYGELTMYLERKRNDHWQEEMKSEQIVDKKYVLHSPYYLKNEYWKVTRCTFEVNDEEKQGFFEYIKSYGDFAIPHFSYEYREETFFEEEDGIEKGRDVETYSLCRTYNSYKLMKKISKKDLPSMPHTKDELLWLFFVVNKYPNMCRLFLDDSEYQRVLKKIDDQIKKLEIKQDLFDEKIWDFGERVQDIAYGITDKYRTIYKVIRDAQILKYVYGAEFSNICPYAMEYNVQKHWGSKERYPFKIMCYNLDEKRNILIPYKNIRVKNCIESRKEQNINVLDQLYHTLSFLIRTAMMGVRQLSEEYEAIAEKILPKDHRGSSHYERCIYKKIRKNNFDIDKDYKELCDYEKKYCEETFRYIVENKNTLSKDYIRHQTVLIHYILEYIKKSKKKTSENIVSEDVSWHLISGDAVECKEERAIKGRTKTEVTVVPNEIIFYNIYLKNKEFIFYIKNPSPFIIEKVYKAFNEFGCIGEWEEDHANGKLKIKVFYEAFKYRRLHEMVMTIYEYIEILSPEEEKNILEARISNIL